MLADGASRDGIHPAKPPMAAGVEQFCDLVPDVGPQEQANILGGVEPRIFRRRS